MLDCSEFIRVDDLTLRLVSSDSGLRAIEFGPWPPLPDGQPVSPSGTHPIIAETARQLRAYFAGQIRQFNLPLDLRGTQFQLRVWHELERIPYGETRSYSQIADAIGSPHAVRAVGAANGSNPIPIVVPCHRVIGANGKLVGYGGGLPLKKRLLELEGARALPLRY